ncbi:unnamed protein product [Strongylus vulgaris]|uniref:Uncharacterized protein n=1 Tax=Strongylus vulgaris TaxID=40348 RepID=A0A3P7IS17_STRVU|nr:unnamed protein product [Strongylus vulgaris]
MECKAVANTIYEENITLKQPENFQNLYTPDKHMLQNRDDVKGESLICGKLEEAVACSSMDPITRDVERRMSMKRECSHSEAVMSEDSRLKQFSGSRSSIDLAKTWARSYGSFASGLFRGAFQKVKTAADSSVSLKAEDSTDSEAEQSESGQQSSGHGTNIVRPRKAKKGPFDFEHLRIVQIVSFMRNMLIKGSPVVANALLNNKVLLKLTNRSCMSIPDKAPFCGV